MKLPAIAVPVLSAALLLAVTACGDDTVEPAASAPAATAAPSTPAGTLEPRTFVATAATGFTIVEGSTITITFDEGRISANAGCNSMSGAYTVADGVLQVEPMAMTEMACEPALMEQDTTIADLLTSSPAIALDGDTLTIGDQTRGMTLLDREVADPDRPLTGTTWTATSVVSNDAVSSGWGEATATIVFDVADGATEGTALVEAGCNRGSAPVTVTEETISFGPLALTRMMCDEAAMELEAAVTATLTGEVTYEIEADRLTLMNGSNGLELTSGG